MSFGDLYERQVRLLIRTLPFVLVETEFALKGGTAINLFVRDLPRLGPQTVWTGFGWGNGEAYRRK